MAKEVNVENKDNDLFAEVFETDEVGSNESEPVDLKPEDVEDFFNQGLEDPTDVEEPIQNDVDPLKQREMQDELKEAEEDIKEIEKEENQQEEPKQEEINYDENSFKPITLSFRGQEIEVGSIDELKTLAQKGLEYTYLKDEFDLYKPLIDQAKIYGFEPDELTALGDAKQGKEEALYYLANKFGLSLKTEEDDFLEEPKKREVKYEPKVQTKNPIEEYFESIMNTNPQLGSNVVNIFESLPAQFKQELWTLENFRMFVEDVSNGKFNEFYKRAMLLKANNPAHTWLSAYMEAKTIPQKKEEPKEPPKSIQQTNNVKTNVERVNKPITFEDLLEKEPSVEEIEKELFGSFI